MRGQVIGFLLILGIKLIHCSVSTYDGRNPNMTQAPTRSMTTTDYTTSFAGDQDHIPGNYTTYIPSQVPTLSTDSPTIVPTTKPPNASTVDSVTGMNGTTATTETAVNEDSGNNISNSQLQTTIFMFGTIIIGLLIIGIILCLIVGYKVNKSKKKMNNDVADLQKRLISMDQAAAINLATNNNTTAHTALLNTDDQPSRYTAASLQIEMGNVNNNDSQQTKGKRKSRSKRRKSGRQTKGSIEKKHGHTQLQQRVNSMESTDNDVAENVDENYDETDSQSRRDEEMYDNRKNTGGNNGGLATDGVSREEVDADQAEGKNIKINGDNNDIGAEGRRPSQWTQQQKHAQPQDGTRQHQDQQKSEMQTSTSTAGVTSNDMYTPNNQNLKVVKDKGITVGHDDHDDGVNVNVMDKDNIDSDIDMKEDGDIVTYGSNTSTTKKGLTGVIGPKTATATMQKNVNHVADDGGVNDDDDSHGHDTISEVLNNPLVDEINGVQGGNVKIDHIGDIDAQLIHDVLDDDQEHDQDDASDENVARDIITPGDKPYENMNNYNVDDNEDVLEFGD